MLAEDFFSSVCGPPLSSNTAIAKEIGIYTHSLWPTFAAKSAFKKSATPPNCLAASQTHVFAAQHEKAYVHVYSRLRNSQEAFVAFPERIRSLTLAGDVLILGTVEGRIMLWEVGSSDSDKFPQLIFSSLTTRADLYREISLTASLSRSGCILRRGDAVSSPYRLRRL